ncbi:RNA polymerase factor sigma-54 [Bordetella sp. 15P40C-2]|uniref:RNA polymerase factor sigma-54 n=1 Tax=Bordetella sp. 15P40C-2 TaxID=2572246 RepID=UPI0013245C2F|nr:RNA polymerase factor sigma-54 [Bordetella sp. 15P40C-2]MVW73245.1 RNA polymerase factor sigma-54 [Bordetella sp. 15P40C-2]
MRVSYAATELRIRQTATLAPRMQQSVQLLQMSALEFSVAIQNALNTNPFLEDDSTHADDGDAAAHEGQTAEAPVMGATEPSLQEYSMHPSSGESLSYSGDYPTRRAALSDGGDHDVAHWVAAQQTLQSRLREALCSYPLSDRDELLTEYIIDALDEDGYLRTSLDSLAGQHDFDPTPQASEWTAALRLVQNLLAPGIGARDLSECLELQLRAADDDEPEVTQLALTIVRSHLDLLARNDWNALLRVTQSTAALLREACDRIRALDPRPGRRYDQEAPMYVIPDVIVRKDQGRWLVIPNRDAMPRARLDRVYADLFRHARHDDRGPLAQELQEARWLVRNVEQRYSTIQRVAEAIVQRQQRFFEYGEVALRPLLLREIADALEIHESTVSRATANKYMITPRGLYEFRHFFSRELATASGGSCSAASVQALIREWIAEEDPRDPLSDVALAERLAADGIVVARRTVSKYRAQLKLPSAELRRRH